MAIVLYHGGSAANSLKALLPLFEKKVDFQSHLMRLIDFEQHEPWFVKINPQGQVPVLVHDERVLNESTLINEYVDDTFPGLPLKPSDAFGRHQICRRKSSKPRWRASRSRSSRTSGARAPRSSGRPSSSATGAAR
jgi:glutathione S-transferase